MASTSPSSDACLQDQDWASWAGRPALLQRAVDTWARQTTLAELSVFTWISRPGPCAQELAKGMHNFLLILAENLFPKRSATIRQHNGRKQMLQAEGVGQPGLPWRRPHRAAGQEPTLEQMISSDDCTLGSSQVVVREVQLPEVDEAPGDDRGRDARQLAERSSSVIWKQEMSMSQSRSTQGSLRWDHFTRKSLGEKWAKHTPVVNPGLTQTWNKAMNIQV